MIEITHFSKKFGDFTALCDISLSIPCGSIFGFVGVNGAGKSTLLRAMAGVLSADNGSISFDGENIFENELKKKEILFLSDDPFYSLGMKASDLVKLYSTFYNFDHTVFDYYSDTFGLCSATPLRNFSKGMRRQLFVALAFAANPKYLLLDEVFDGLDPASRLIFKRGLINHTAEGGTAVVASHSLRELEDICDSFAIIDNKTITDFGSVHDALNNLYKFNMAFNTPIPREKLGFDCLSYHSSGRIIKIIVSGDKQFYLGKIAELNPLVVDEQAIDLEEYFVLSTQNTK